MTEKKVTKNSIAKNGLNIEAIGCLALSDLVGRKELF